MISNFDGEQALLVEVENSSNETVYVSVGDTTINGLSVQSGAWSIDGISPGKRKVVSMNLASMQSYQEILGLSEVGSVTYSIEVMDTDLDTLAVPQTITFSVPSSTASYDASGTEIYQENGIRIVSKGLVEDDFKYSDDIHVLLLVENNSSELLRFDIDYDSVSVNGYMTDFFCYGTKAPAGGVTVLDVELRGSSLDDNGISSMEDIVEVEMTVEIETEHYKTVAEPVLTFDVKPA